MPNATDTDFDGVSLETLRERQSAKWRVYPEDVLPAWVAEMDIPLLLAERLPAVGYVPPQASFLAWLDCGALGLGPDPAAVLLRSGRIALTPGLDFGRQGAGFARLNIGTSAALLTEAVDRMAKATNAPPP
jgi:bifunctional pyridoxal-dependent enzyme with beta-cystathionase and maltose regulon repressor activities